MLGERYAGVFDGVQAGSPLPAVEKGAAMAAETGADLLVALGGGSAVVTTRAIIILLAEGGNAQDHATKYPPGLPPVSPRLMKPKIPNIIVATTPTTATSRAGTAVIDPETVLLRRGRTKIRLHGSSLARSISQPSKTAANLYSTRSLIYLASAVCTPPRYGICSPLFPGGPPFFEFFSDFFRLFRIFSDPFILEKF